MWSASPILALVVTLLVPSAWYVPVAPETDDAWSLVWKNGDALPGKPLESGSGVVRWASPPFAEALVIDTTALDSIVFAGEAVEPAEAYRVRTVSGDVLVADLVGVEGAAFVFSSQRHGRVRVDRDMVYTLDRRSHPNLLFDGSQWRDWSPVLGHAGGAPGSRMVLAASSWGPDAEGHPHTDKPQAELQRALDWPERFEVAIEFASTERPGFALALGRGVNQALRLETWGDDLVIAQGRQFKRVLVVQEGQNEVRLRLAFDGRAGAVTVHDMGGRLLAELADVQPLEKDAGLTIRSRGRDLTLKLLRAYRQTGAIHRQAGDRARPRVHTMDGQVIYGRLTGDDAGVYVQDDDGVLRDINLAAIDRVLRPDIELGAVWGPAELTYHDGSVLRGWIEGLDGDSVTLRTAFAEEPVTAALAGASRLDFGSRAGTAEGPEFADRLFHSSGEIRGRLSFSGQGGSLIAWQVAGGVAPVAVSLVGGARIRRGSRPESTLNYDRAEYPDVLRLNSREVIACKIVSADEEQVVYRSPFIDTRTLATRHVKAIELSTGPIGGNVRDGGSVKVSRGQTLAIEGVVLGPEDNQGAQTQISFTITGGDGSSITLPINGNAGTIRVDGDGTVFQIRADGRAVRLEGDGRFIPLRRDVGGVDREALDRALTVPRFLRDDPPTHLLGAKTGDLLRGRFLGIDERSVRFESNFRSLDIPIGRVASIVDISIPDDGPNTPDAATDTGGMFRVTLTDGSSLEFAPIESKGGVLSGRSPIYGTVAVPVSSVDHVRAGSNATDGLTSFLDAWVVRPAKEPEYGGDE